MKHPDSPDVDSGPDACADYGKESHRFGETVDGGSPLLPEQEKDSGDQGPRMTYAYPEDEVDDSPAPSNGNIDAPDSHSPKYQPAYHPKHQHRQRRCEGDGNVPVEPGFIFDDAADLFGDVVISRIPRNQRRVG